MLKAPSCQMNCNGLHWYHNFLYGTITDSIGTTSGHIGTLPTEYHHNFLYGTITDSIGTTSGHIGTLPTEHLSQQSLCNCQHIECSLFFPFQETKTDTFCSSHAKFQQFFPLINFSCKGSLFFGHSLKVFQLTASGVNTNTSTWFLPLGLFCTYTQDHMANFSQSKQVFLCNHMRDMRELRYKPSQDHFRLPQSRFQASTQGTYTHNTGPFSNGTSLSKLRTMIAAGASATSGYNVHTHIKFLPKS